MWRLKSRKKAADTAKKARNGRGKKPRPFQFEALEPRLLLSADMIIPVDDLNAVPGTLPPVIEEAAPAEVETVQECFADVGVNKCREGLGLGAGCECVCELAGYFGNHICDA
ncbi:MAG: hypothetical protein CVU61_17075, partial [Deltaproteobacteria bacterium HGW-Deltaproteobacteria-19]